MPLGEVFDGEKNLRNHLTRDVEDSLFDVNGVVELSSS
jgi:hypothetical protein